MAGSWGEKRGKGFISISAPGTAAIRHVSGYVAVRAKRRSLKAVLQRAAVKIKRLRDECDQVIGMRAMRARRSARRRARRRLSLGFS